MMTDLLTPRPMTQAQIADLVKRTRGNMNRFGSDAPCIATRLARFACRFAALEDITLPEAWRQVIALTRCSFTQSAVYHWWRRLYPRQPRPGRP
jgi:hypothetical protein